MASISIKVCSELISKALILNSPESPLDVMDQGLKSNAFNITQSLLYSRLGNAFHIRSSNETGMPMAQSCELPAGISLFYYCRFTLCYYSSVCFIACKMATFCDAAVLSYVPAPGPLSCRLRTMPFIVVFHFILFFFFI